MFIHTRFDLLRRSVLNICFEFWSLLISNSVLFSALISEKFTESDVKNSEIITKKHLDKNFQTIPAINLKNNSEKNVKKISEKNALNCVYGKSQKAIHSKICPQEDESGEPTFHEINNLNFMNNSSLRSRVPFTLLKQMRRPGVSNFLIVTLLLIFIPATQAAWWFVSQIQSSSGKIHCGSIPGLVRRQRLLCERNPEMMVSLAQGATLGIKECQFQFQNSKWNCSIFARDNSVYGQQILRRASYGGTKESSFVHAINSAAVVHSVTRACNEGALPHCACDPTKQGVHKDRRGEFTWGGCSDNLRFSTSFARRFIDAPEKRQRDVRAKAILHNNRVGRKSIRKQTRLQCKCHGVSGSCSYRTCWLTTSPFRKASQWLKERYENAILVSAKPDGTGLLHRGKRQLRKMDLVYLEQSPNYCRVNPKKGYYGTADRQCNATSADPDGCFSLCCGRGYYTKRQLVQVKCECKFQWCCHVSCKMCESWEQLNYCNSQN